MQLCHSLATKKTMHIALKYLFILHKLIILIQSVLLQRHISLLVIQCVMGNSVIEIGWDQKKKLAPYSSLYLHCGHLNSNNSQDTYVELGVIQTAFIHSSIALQPIRVKRTRAIAELTVNSELCRREVGEAGTNHRGPAFRKGARDPNKLCKLLSLSVVSLLVDRAN